MFLVIQILRLAQLGRVSGLGPESQTFESFIGDIRGVAQLIECIVWGYEAAGLSPAIPTNIKGIIYEIP